MEQAACQDPEVVLRSPNTEAALLAAAAASIAYNYIVAGQHIIYYTFRLAFTRGHNSDP